MDLCIFTGMKNQYLFLFYLLLMLAFAACRPNTSSTPTPTDPFAHIQDMQAKDLLSKAIARAGGLDKWQSINTLSFQKYFMLYDSSGQKEYEVLQTVDYTFQPAEQVEINWNDSGTSHKMVYQNEQVVKTVNSQVDTSANQQSLLNSVQSATFVISIPFKLLDKSATVSYAGVDTLENNQVVEVLKVTYTPESDTWWHYFAQGDYAQIGYMVQHADHFSYVKNLRFSIVEGIIFPQERESYRVDSEGNLLYLRAKYLYRDYKVTF